MMISMHLYLFAEFFFCTTAVDISVWKEMWVASYRLPGSSAGKQSRCQYDGVSWSAMTLLLVITGCLHQSTAFGC